MTTFERDHTLIIGNTQSGKSFLCNWLIEKVFKDIYDVILLISGTVDSVNGDIYTNIPDKNKTKCLDNKTMNYIKFVAKNNPNSKILLILDDLNKMLSKTGTTKEKEIARECESNIIYLFSEGRHDNLYSVALVQYYRQLKPIIRSNSRYQIITFGGNTLCDLLFEYLDNCFSSVKELKDFVKKNNICYKKIGDKKYLTSIMFDCYDKSRNKKEAIRLLQP